MSSISQSTKCWITESSWFWAPGSCLLVSRRKWRMSTGTYKQNGQTEWRLLDLLYTVKHLKLPEVVLREFKQPIYSSCCSDCITQHPYLYLGLLHIKENLIKFHISVHIWCCSAVWYFQGWLNVSVLVPLDKSKLESRAVIWYLKFLNRGNYCTVGGVSSPEEC